MASPFRSRLHAALVSIALSTVIPELRHNRRELFDVDAFDYVPVEVDPHTFLIR